MEQPLSDRPSLRTILVVLVVALAVLLAALRDSFRRPAAAPPAVPSPVTIQAPSDLDQTIGVERAQDGLTPSVGPHETEGPLC